MAKYFANIPLQPENLKSLRDAVIKNVLEDEDLKNVLTIKKVRSGEPLAVIGEMDAVGHAGAGCTPTYDEIGIGNQLKRWALGAWSIALSICYENLEDTIAEYCLKTGTEIADLTGTDFMAIYLELLTTQMKRMLWRLAWFGDTTAQNITNGGKITDGQDVTLITPNDGLFKRLFAIATAAPGQRTTIAANAQTTYAAQTAAIRQAGVASGIVDSILMDADPMITASGEATLFMNKKLADALALDIKQTYKDNLPFERIFDGFYLAYYNGVRIASIPTWDFMINTYENTGTAWNLPFRAVLASPKNLLLGCDAENPLSDLDIWFEKKDRMNYVYAAGKLDTLVAEDERVHVAY